MPGAYHHRYPIFDRRVHEEDHCFSGLNQYGAMLVGLFLARFVRYWLTISDLLVFFRWVEDSYEFGFLDRGSHLDWFLSPVRPGWRSLYHPKGLLLLVRWSVAWSSPSPVRVDIRSWPELRNSRGRERTEAHSSMPSWIIFKHLRRASDINISYLICQTADSNPRKSRLAPELFGTTVAQIDWAPLPLNSIDGHHRWDAE